ncbi:MAG: thioredoxin-dependent thiol peroxidase [Crocinitomicaceae bacterium]|nr:MAG: thioredoxin-dependent thiol peroxidase [Crocinitomicaceae bacterium]
MTSLKINDTAPSFAGKDESGKLIQSSDFEGKKYALYFYPKDNTPGCTVQACNLRDNYAALTAEGIAIIGVSMDSEVAHQKFIAKYELPFPLIADTDKQIIESFGVWGPKKFMGKEYDGIHRTTFVMDEENKIRGIISKPKTKDHAAEILEIFNSI